MSQQTFSRRTVAIAVAASVAVGGAPIVGANGPLAAITPTANAQEASEKAGVTTNDVTFGGFYNGDGNKVDGPFFRQGTQGNNTGHTMNQEGGYTVRYTVDFKNALPGDVLQFGPSNDFTDTINDKEITNSQHAGVRVYATTEPIPIEVDGKEIGTYQLKRSGGIIVRFNENVADIKDGSLPIEAPVMVWEQYVSPPKDEDWDGQSMREITQAKTYSRVAAYRAATKEWEYDRTFVANTTTNIRVSPSQRNVLRSATLGDLRVDPNTYVTKVPYFTTELPAGKGGTLDISIDTENNSSLQWTLEDDLPYRVTFAQFAKDDADDPYEIIEKGISAEDAKTKFPDMKWNITRSGDTFKATFDNVPEGVKAYIRFDKSGLSGAGTYTPGNKPRINMKLTDQDGNVTTKSHTLGTVPTIPAFGEATGSSFVRTAELDASIVGQPSDAGKATAAKIGGTKQTFQFFIKNTGEGYLAAPLVTLPNGKKQVVENFKAAPGETGSFTVDYDVPADAGVLNFNVEMSRAELSPSNTVSFRYSVADQADSATGNIKYDTNGGKKEAPRGQVTEIPAKGVPEGASAARTPDTPAWAEIGPDGKLTLKPDNSAPLGRTEIPVKFTFPDGSETTVTPVITVAEEDKSKSTFDPRTQDEKSNDEINKRLDDLKKENADQAKKLGEIDAALDKSNKLTKEQTDAIKDQTDKLGKSIDDQKKAIDALKEATEKGDKAIVEAMKEQSEAINSALNSIETTIREGDAAALEEAKKQTAQLDKNNKLIEAQNKELANQTEQLKAQSETLKKQAATLEKVRAELDKANKLTEEQNKLIQDQIDAINAQTEAIDNLIDATEKQTAEITARLDDANKIAAEQRDIMGKELAESIKQTAEMKRQSKALERQNQILIDQHKDQLAQWEKENEFAQNEQDDRRHKDNFKRCITSDPATAALISLPIISLLAAVGVPYTGHMLEDANTQLTALNNQLGTQVGIPADLQRQINDFNANYGDMVRTGATALAGIGAVVGLAVAINNLTGGCYAEADKSVGREPQAPKTSSDSVLSSKPWVQETAAPEADAENTDAEAEDAEVATQ